MLKKLIEAFAPPPPNPYHKAQAVKFLREIAATEDGVIYDTELDVPDHVLAVAIRQGWVSHGGGWGVGIAITDKGLREVEAA